VKRTQQGRKSDRTHSKAALAILITASAAMCSSSLALANVATTRQNEEAIVGAWVGQAAQPDQDPFDVRLTFVSPRGGVSRYPGEPSCGGVLTGSRDGDHFEYEEAITYGSSEEVDQGCLNGKLKLTVDGDTMKYDWTSTNAEGSPLTSSGELHRQAAGGARKR
jgi:hypothetical protein